jgi:hypothetical protein
MLGELCLTKAIVMKGEKMIGNREVYIPPEKEEIIDVMNVIVDDLNNLLPQNSRVSITNELSRIIGRDRKYARAYIKGERTIQKAEWEAVMVRYNRLCG